jgi:hypothetical protein
VAAPDGLLAIIGEKKEKGSESSDSEPGSAKARALKAMWSAMKSGNFDAAAEEFQTAYDACAMKGSEGEAEADTEHEYED